MQERHKQALGLATAEEVKSLTERLARAEASLGAARKELELLPARVAGVEASLSEAKQVQSASGCLKGLRGEGDKVQVEYRTI